MNKYYTEKEIGYVNTTAKQTFHIKTFDRCTHQDISHPFPSPEFESILTEVFFFLESITKRVFEILIKQCRQEKNWILLMMPSI